MTIFEIILATAIVSSAFYIPLFRGILKRERQVIKAQKLLLQAERIQFFQSLQEKASKNAVLPCRTCSSCKRVVHRYRPIADGYICKECDLDSKGAA